MSSITASAGVNIAVVKYWGKRDEDLILPVNSSLSVTLNQDCMKTVTTISSLPQGSENDEFSLNGEILNINKFPRILRVLSLVRNSSDTSLRNTKVRITSRNDFPTAAGLASSASGLACLAASLGKFFHFTETFPGELSIIARQGSGSACRSMYGGFVAWNKGEKIDGSDSLAHQIADETHWPELCAIVVVASAAKKAVGSTTGMRNTVETSELMNCRLNTASKRMDLMTTAIMDRNFEQFASLTMMDSNQFHAVCLDTYPPIFYLNEASQSIISAIHSLNVKKDSIIAGYTFDAGPNAVIFTLQRNLGTVLEVMEQTFPKFFIENTVKDPMGLVNYEPNKSSTIVDNRTEISNIIITNVGTGPQFINEVNK